jgi:hypothetical protein
VKVEVLYRNDPERPLTDPLPEREGRRLIVRVYRGDYCDPMFDRDGWFGAGKPKAVLRGWLLWMPFIAWRWPFSARAGYFGFKLYGVDSPVYKTFLPPEEVYDGSQACHFSVRPFATAG